MENLKERIESKLRERGISLYSPQMLEDILFLVSFYVSRGQEFDQAFNEAMEKIKGVDYGQANFN